MGSHRQHWAIVPLLLAVGLLIALLQPGSGKLPLLLLHVVNFFLNVASVRLPLQSSEHLQQGAVWPGRRRRAAPLRGLEQRLPRHAGRCDRGLRCSGGRGGPGQHPVGPERLHQPQRRGRHQRPRLDRAVRLHVPGAHRRAGPGLHLQSARTGRVDRPSARAGSQGPR
jgi:hypothetical protein